MRGESFKIMFAAHVLKNGKHWGKLLLCECFFCVVQSSIVKLFAVCAPVLIGWSGLLYTSSVVIARGVVLRMKVLEWVNTQFWSK